MNPIIIIELTHYTLNNISAYLLLEFLKLTESDRHYWQRFQRKIVTTKMILSYTFCRILIYTAQFLRHIHLFIFNESADWITYRYSLLMLCWTKEHCRLIWNFVFVIMKRLLKVEMCNILFLCFVPRNTTTSFG